MGHQLATFVLSRENPASILENIMRSFLLSFLLFALYCKAIQNVSAAPSEELEFINGLNEDAGLDDRIINGLTRAIKDDPWMVSLNDKKDGNKHFCGGVLIDAQWVLT